MALRCRGICIATVARFGVSCSDLSEWCALLSVTNERTLKTVLERLLSAFVPLLLLTGQTAASPKIADSLLSQKVDGNSVWAHQASSASAGSN